MPISYSAFQLSIIFGYMIFFHSPGSCWLVWIGQVAVHGKELALYRPIKIAVVSMMSPLSKSYILSAKKEITLGQFKNVYLVFFFYVKVLTFIGNSDLLFICLSFHPVSEQFIHFFSQMLTALLGFANFDSPATSTMLKKKESKFPPSPTSDSEHFLLVTLAVAARKGVQTKLGVWSHSHTWHSGATTPCCWWGTRSAVNLQCLTMWHAKFVTLPSVHLRFLVPFPFCHPNWFPNSVVFWLRDNPVFPDQFPVLWLPNFWFLLALHLNSSMYL